MTSVKPLAARFYRLKYEHACTGIYPKRFGHEEDNKCWWCERIVPQTREHLFCHCSRCNDHQKVFWKSVGKVTGWKVGRCCKVQVSELFSIPSVLWAQSTFHTFLSFDSGDEG
jgi:hypothetical protein